MFNTTSSVAVGSQIAELLGSKNNHFMACINKITIKPVEEQKDEGTIGAEA